MQKVYLLLRSNKQTGPYSLEELLQLNLKPFDLVWVEGRSAAWQYPFEIPALKPYVPETPQAEVPFQPIATAAMEEPIAPAQSPLNTKTETPKRVFVSVPKTYTPPYRQSAYKEKEETRPDAPSYQQSVPLYAQQKPVVDEEALQTNYSRPLDEVEEDYTNWIYKQKTKKKSSISQKDLLLAGLILVVIAGGYYVISRPSVANSVLPANKIATQAKPLPAETNSAEPETKNEVLSADQGIITNTNEEPSKPTKTINTKNPASVSKSQTNTPVPTLQNSMPVEKTTPNIPTDHKDVIAEETEIKSGGRVENAPGKKKKLGDVIKGIFSKKDKKEEVQNEAVVLEDPKPATNRQATRREDNSNSSNTNSETGNRAETNTAALSSQIDLYSNAPDNWMMGVKNLKITLRNRCNVTLQTASVTVNYYDENDQLLEKKLVYFNNVAPKAKATVAAPDHKWADHVDFKLTTVSAKDDRYASY